jgi:hypothetical protein
MNSLKFFSEVIKMMIGLQGICFCQLPDIYLRVQMNIDTHTNKIASGFELKVVSAPPQDVKNLLTSTIYGIKGGMQYRHKNVDAKIDRLPNSFFVTLRRHTKLLGTVGFMFRKTIVNKVSLASYYVRYLSINSKTKRKGSKFKNSAKDSSERFKKNNLKSGLSQLMLEHFTNPILVKNESSLFYAFVDKDNVYSQSLCKEFGYKKIRNISTIIFSRIFPKKSSEVFQLKESEKEFVLNRLAEEYKYHNFYFKDHTVVDDNYFVVKANGRIVAGLKASPIEWEIVNIPGLSGFIIKNIFPVLPFFKRLFNSREFRFTAFDAIWYEPGYENKLIELMESTCAVLNLHIGITWLDKQSIIKERLYKTKKLGMLHQLNNNVPADVLARFINMSDVEIQSFYDRPVYVSSFDLT